MGRTDRERSAAEETSNPPRRHHRMATTAMPTPAGRKKPSGSAGGGPGSHPRSAGSQRHRPAEPGPVPQHPANHRGQDKFVAVIGHPPSEVLGTEQFTVAGRKVARGIPGDGDGHRVSLGETGGKEGVAAGFFFGSYRPIVVLHVLILAIQRFQCLFPFRFRGIGLLEGGGLCGGKGGVYGAGEGIRFFIYGVLGEQDGPRSRTIWKPKFSSSIR